MEEKLGGLGARPMASSEGQHVTQNDLDKINERLIEEGLKPIPPIGGAGTASVDNKPEPSKAGGIDGVAFTIFAKSNGPLTKSIELGADGSLVSNSSECMMARGRARRAFVTNLGEFADLISALGQNEAIGLGQLAADLPDDVAVVTAAELNGDSAIARTAKYITYPPNKPAFLLIDHDTKGMPDEVRERLREAGGFWPALVSVCPALKGAGRVERASTSAGLHRTDTGKKFEGSGGQHIYIVIRDGSDAERYLSDLHDRCTVAGFGWGMIGEAGQFLERSIVDRTVGGPERLAFEGRPVLKAPLEQDAEVRRAKAIDGCVLNTVIAWAPLTVGEKSKLAKMRAKERARLGAEIDRKREAFVRKHGGTLSARMMCDGVLLPDVVLPFDDPKFNGVTVGAVLEDPARYDGATLADPIEGVAYGRCKAKVMRRADGVRKTSRKTREGQRQGSVMSEGRWVPATLPLSIARMYLNGLTEEERGLRPLRGITQAPILGEAGSIRTAQGYDDATGLYCHRVPAVKLSNGRGYRH